MPQPKIDRDTIAIRVARRLSTMDHARLARALRWMRDHELRRLDEITAEAEASA